MDTCFFVSPQCWDKNKGYRVLTATYQFVWPTSIYAGHDFRLAELVAQDMNEKMGVSLEEAVKILNVHFPTPGRMQ